MVYTDKLHVMVIIRFVEINCKNNTEINISMTIFYQTLAKIIELFKNLVYNSHCTNEVYGKLYTI